METQKYKEAFKKALPLINALASLNPEAFLQVKLASDGGADVVYFADRGDEKEAFNIAIKYFGKLKKSEDGILKGGRDGVSLRLW